jgi:hypothetical protein
MELDEINQIQRTITLEIVKPFVSEGFPVASRIILRAKHIIFYFVKESLKMFPYKQLS